jgi:elongation factor G
MRKDLRLPACAVQIPIGVENEHQGVVDLVTMKAFKFQGPKGETVVEEEIPEDLVEFAKEKRTEMIENLANVDEEIGEIFLMEEVPTNEQIKAAIRRQTIDRKFVPVFMGSAYKNKGVQLLLDGVSDYLPSPLEKHNVAFDLQNKEAEIPITCDPTAPLIALAFKLEESKFGQLTYLRIYQGTIKKGMNSINMSTGKKVRFPRLVKMHSNEMEDVDSASAGDVVVAFGLECASMDTFTDGTLKVAMRSMFVPNPVMSISIKPKDSSKLAAFGKAMGKFTREDPTLRIDSDEITNETILSGMGELHLEIYVERMKREYGVECVTGQPTVNYKETITTRADFNYLHKKQTGGAGQYARVIGYVEPLTEEEIAAGKEFEFENKCIGTNIPSEYYPSCEKGAIFASKKGVLAGFPLTGVRVVLLDGQAHLVDSSDLAFQIAMRFGIRSGVQAANAQILEPIMSLEVNSPSEFQGAIVGGINKRNGMINNSDLNEDGSKLLVTADVPLAELFGYSTDLRSTTQGKGEFAMEYKCHQPTQPHIQKELIKKYTDGLKDEES